MGQMTKELWFDSWHGQETFLYSKSSRHALGPNQTPLSWTFALLSPAVKWLEREVQHLLPPSARDENKWSYNITSPICLNGVHRDKSDFTCHLHCPHFSTSIYSNYLLKTWLHSEGCKKKAAYLSCECNNVIFFVN